MPFCRECGKEVQDDWNSCPFCKADIQVTNIQDSVVIGNVISTTNVNDPTTITTAVKSAAECSNCNSVGATIHACKSCRKLAFCGICEEDVVESRISKLSPRAYFNNEVPENYAKLSQQRKCDECFIQTVAEEYETCETCGLFHTEDEDTRCVLCGIHNCLQCGTINEGRRVVKRDFEIIRMSTNSDHESTCPIIAERIENAEKLFVKVTSTGGVEEFTNLLIPVAEFHQHVIEPFKWIDKDYQDDLRKLFRNWMEASDGKLNFQSMPNIEEFELIYWQCIVFHHTFWAFVNLHQKEENFIPSEYFVYSEDELPFDQDKYLQSGKSALGAKLHQYRFYAAEAILTSNMTIFDDLYSLVSNLLSDNGFNHIDEFTLSFLEEYHEVVTKSLEQKPPPPPCL